MPPDLAARDRVQLAAPMPDDVLLAELPPSLCAVTAPQPPDTSALEGETRADLCVVVRAVHRSLRHIACSRGRRLGGSTGGRRDRLERLGA
jgi:hypothetical protein